MRGLAVYRAPSPLTSEVYQSSCYGNDSAEGTVVESAIEFAWCAPGRRQRRQRPSAPTPNQRLTLPAGRGTRASGGLVFSPTATTALSPHTALPAPVPQRSSVRAVPRAATFSVATEPNPLAPSRIPSPTTRRPSSRRPHLLQPVAGDSATSLGSSFSGLALTAICVRVDLLGQAISNLQTPKDQLSYQCGRH